MPSFVSESAGTAGRAAASFAAGGCGADSCGASAGAVWARRWKPLKPIHSTNRLRNKKRKLRRDIAKAPGTMRGSSLTHGSRAKSAQTDCFHSPRPAKSEPNPPDTRIDFSYADLRKVDASAPTRQIFPGPLKISTLEMPFWRLRNTTMHSPTLHFGCKLSARFQNCFQNTDWAPRMFPIGNNHLPHGYN